MGLEGKTLGADALAQLVGEITEEILRTRSQNVESAPANNLPHLESRLVSASRPTAVDMAARLDHTSLKPEATRKEIALLCAEARDYGFATVCVQPIWVSAAERELRGSSVGVCTVVGFPSGALPVAVKCLEAELAIRKGAQELDMVLPVGLLQQGELDYVKAEIGAVAEITRRSGALLKVILETALLSDIEIAVACALAKLAGADYVKTSTGFHPAGGATEAHVKLMRLAVGNELGVKAAGGIRSAEAAWRMLAAGASRIGSSASVRILEELAR